MLFASGRSYYSLMHGCSSPADLCARAKSLGYSSLALFDIDSIIGLWPFLAACREHGLRPLPGAEVSDPRSRDTLLCMVRNPEGYRSLCNLLTRRKCDPEFSLQRDVPGQHNGLIVLASSIPLLNVLQQEKGLELYVNLGDRPTSRASRLRKWALQHRLPAVSVHVALMARKSDKTLFRLMRAIGTNSRFHSGEDGDEHLSRWLRPPALRKERFAVWPEVLVATEALLQRCCFSGPDFGLVMPPWKGKGADATVALEKAAYKGACKRYGTDLSEAVVERLEHELRTIDSMGFSSYFLVVRDIVHELAGGRGKPGRLPRICGRGSGAASLVAYCLEITNVCPVKHNLYFERFLHPGRSDPPDIDIDFAWDERDAILARVLERYGSRAAMVSTVVRFQLRMALRETAKAFGMPATEVSRMGKLQRLPHKGREAEEEPWSTILRLASALVGIPRHLSVHPGGVLITPAPVRDYVVVERAAKGVPIIQWDKDGAEEAGLVKIDLLGNRSLGVIRDCIASIRGEGRSFDEEYWQPEEDAATQEAVAVGKTMGCFYIESPAMRLLQQKAGSGDFEQLVIQSSIIRPAANDFVREYVRRLHGGEWQHLHPRLADVLDETYGLMVYQEDVSRVAVSLAGFSAARADGLRKVMSKKDKFLRLGDYRREFDAGCARRGVDAQTREKLWQMMMSFDGYSFCKPHSASYARVSYQAAYLKVHHPAEFMAAVISNQGGYYSTFAYVSEARRLGLQVLHPCVNGSGIAWQGEQGRLRVGLAAVKGLSVETMERLIRCREERSFVTSLDFWQRVRPQKDEGRALIQAGALDSLAGANSRSMLSWEFAQFLSLAKQHQNSPLFELQLVPPPTLHPFPQKELLHQEFAVLGFLCGTHPIEFHGERVQDRVRASELHRFRGRRVSITGWLITGKLVSTKSGEVMEFLTFEDESGLVETVFFPRVYRRYAHILSSGNPYLLQGMVDEDYGATTLRVERVKKL